MQTAKDFLLSVARRIFSNWSALEMAVAESMGTKDSAIDFCPWITETLFMNENPTKEDIAHALEEYLEINFNTELEDDSQMQVAELLLKFHSYCIEGNEAVALAEMEKLPVLKTWILTRDEIRQANNRTVDEKSDSDSDDNEQMDVAIDDWKEVKTRRKK